MSNNNWESSTNLYQRWVNIKRRCLDPKDKRYKDYGGRGITVCNEWLEFKNFKDWCIHNGYKESLSIDRINNSGNYEPSNCRWVDNKTQSRNRRSNIIVSYGNKNITLIELSELTGIGYQTLSRRYSRGDRGDRLIRNVGKDRNNKGEKNSSSKITEKEAREIKQKILNGEKNCNIAKEYNVSKYLISDIRRGKTWRHI